jgi:hypothetical protein
MEIRFPIHRHRVPRLSAVGAFDQPEVRRLVVVVLAGVAATQEMIGSGNGKSHEVLNNAADEFGITPTGKPVDAIV